MILVALGSNINGPWGSPRQAVERALVELNHWPLSLVKGSTLIETAPFGNKNQPNFVNALAVIDTALPAESLLRRLHMIERAAGRRRAKRWGPRTLDLDIIDYHGLVKAQRGQHQKALVLPHPGIAERSFVLAPIMQIAPHWRHPLTHKTAKVMIQKLYGLKPT
jgi:2-amino-4-hydroxy-6-hydroxymethyldihydropteridine diphosphokinase